MIYFYFRWLKATEVRRCGESVQPSELHRVLWRDPVRTIRQVHILYRCFIVTFKHAADMAKSFLFHSFRPPNAADLLSFWSNN